MRGLFSKGKKVTAAAARRITGISVPFGGLQWADPGPSHGEIIRNFFAFLEDRRVLYNAEQLEAVSQVGHSLGEIRRACTETLQALPARAFAVTPLSAIRAACRRFQDDQQEAFRFFDNPHEQRASPGFFTALGAFRATVGQQVALLAAHYDLDVEGDLARILPRPDKDGP
ncbi:DUF6650 family protein [Roseomonas harenae]|uniref:DUF6650 family protein n=1 Tax=Muricoccus harenae TaxID=2692566 RepID=UPI0013318D06|nr:DUF6650 family protein [Roseomonas harenae]